MTYPEDFERALKFVLKWEGNQYVNDPDDPGGETHYGISKRAHPDIDIQALTYEQAKEIYFREYWEKGDIELNRNDSLKQKLMRFDSFVNMGKRFVYGQDERDMAFERICTYFHITQKNPDLKKYFYGWVSRVMDCLKEGAG